MGPDNGIVCNVVLLKGPVVHWLKVPTVLASNKQAIPISS